MTAASPAAGAQRGCPNRLVIFNADDFGLSSGVNAGIIGAYRNGPLRSASLMVTAPGFAGAIELSREHPSLDLGLHLALTGVPPALPPHEVPSLVMPSGRFPTLPAFVRRLLTGRVDPSEVERELRAQIERGLATGRRFSHLDSHHHTHLFPPVASTVARLAHEYGFRHIRRLPGLRDSPDWQPRAVLRRLGLRAMARSSAGRYRAFESLAAFRGVPFPTTLTAWRRELTSLPSGVTEFMCHPGLADPAVAIFDSLIAPREIELRWLTDPRLSELLTELGLIPTSFAELEQVSEE